MRKKRKRWCKGGGEKGGGAQAARSEGGRAEGERSVELYYDALSSIRLMLMKSISVHHFQNKRKFDNKDFQYHGDVI